MRFGLVGETLGYSFSPLIHEAVFKALEVESAYDLIELKKNHFDSRIQDVLTSYAGLNFTIPYKLDVMPYLDQIDSKALKIGAVNTVLNAEEGLIGYNTDYEGIRHTLEDLCESLPDTAIVLGTGGGSKAVITYLEDKGIPHIYVVSRSEKPGDASNNITMIQYETLESLDLHSFLLVNCTPVGMSHIKTTCLVSDALIQKASAVFDLIYNPLETPLLKKAKAYNIPHENGLKMLIYQAIEAEKIWQKHWNLDENQLYSQIVTKLIEE